MRPTLNRVSLALAVFIGAILLIGITVRGFIYDIERYREVISSQIAETLKLNVSVGKLERGVGLLNPVIYAEQAKFSISDDFDRPLLVKQTEIVLKLLGSVLSIEPRVQSIKMRGVESALSTDMGNSALYLPRIGREFHRSEQWFDINRLLTDTVAIAHYDLNFHDVLLYWDDKNMEDIKTFHLEHLIVNSQHHQTRLSAATRLPEPLGENLTLTATLKHDPSNLAGDFYINVKNLDITRLYQLANTQSINEGILQTELHGRISYQRGMEKLSGTLALKDGQIHGLNLDNTVPDVETELSRQAQKHNRELNLNGLFVQDENTIIQNADFMVIQTRNEEDYHGKLQFRSDNMSPVVYNEILAYAKTNFSIEQSYTAASVDKQVIDLTLHAGHSSDWFASPHDWSPMQPASDADMPKLLSGDFELVLNDVGFKWNQWHTPQNLKHVKLKGNYKRSAGHNEWNPEQLYIKDINVNLKEPQLNLSQVEGHLYFNKSGVRSDNNGALLNETYALTAIIEPQRELTLLKMQSDMPFPSDYMGNFSLPANAIDIATDIWYGEFLLPSLYAEAQHTLQLKLNSDLKSLTVNMPVPLNKRASEVENSTRIEQITTADSNQFNYGNRFRSTLKVAQAGDVTGSPELSPPIDYDLHEIQHDDWFTGRGVIPRLSINQWLDWLSNYSDITTHSAPYTQDVDVLIEELVWGTSTMHQVHLTVKRQQNKTLLSFDSEEIKGLATIPVNRDERIDIDLDHLVLKGASAFDFPQLELTAFSPMTINVSRLKKDHFDIENLEVVLSPASNGLRIEKISFNKKEGDKTLIQAHLEGNWTKIIDRDYSDFSFLLESDDYGQLLQNWGFYDEMKGGQGQINGQLHWNNSPMDFKQHQLQGLVRLEISDGVLEAVNPRMSKILSLLNIDAFLKRLTDNFKNTSENVSQKGLAFDSMQGYLEFQKADLIIKNLDINTTTFDMKIVGRTDIVQEHYDQKITITPKMGSNIKHLASFLSSDIVYTASLLFNKFAKLDKAIDKSATLEYTLKGSWDNPEVEAVNTSLTPEPD